MSNGSRKSPIVTNSPSIVVRVLIPLALITVWFIGAAIGGPYFGRVSEVSNNDPASYLPSSAEATQVQEQLSEFIPSDAVPAIVVFTQETRFSEAEFATLSRDFASLADQDWVQGDLSPLIPSDDGLAAEAFVPISTEASLQEAVGDLRAELAKIAPDSAAVYVTGPAGFSADLVAGFAGVDGLLLGVALLAVYLILIIVYRSPILPIAVLLTSISALTVALLSNWWLAKAEILTLSGQTQGILFILVIGAATDYSLLYVARYREELHQQADTFQATKNAIQGSIEPILASGGTVIVGLMCLLLSDMRSNSSLGPIASIGIAFSMLAALTFLPAILLFLGRVAFWPRKPRFDPLAVTNASEIGGHGIWSKAATLIQKRHRLIWIVTAFVLFAGALAAPGFKASGIPQSELVVGKSESRDGQNALAEHFPGGSGSPVYVVVPEGDLFNASSTLQADAAIDNVSVTSQDTPAGTISIKDGELQPSGPPTDTPPSPTVVDGHVLLQATLNQTADSNAAMETIRGLRSSLGEVSESAQVGGVTATALDTRDASIDDRNKIIPIALIVIMLILMVLLRSVLAPILLIATTVLSFGTALGVAGFVFYTVLDFPGADPAVPLYGFVFLVALGIDYNIFLMTRVREESLARGTRPGILHGLVVTGGVITSAGVVLAATFAVLSVIPILFLVQLSFIVAFGVLLDTIIVRSLLVPALCYDIGPKIWWPSKLRHEPTELEDKTI